MGQVLTIDLDDRVEVNKKHYVALIQGPRGRIASYNKPFGNRAWTAEEDKVMEERFKGARGSQKASVLVALATEFKRSTKAVRTRAQRRGLLKI